MRAKVLDCFVQLAEYQPSSLPLFHVFFVSVLIGFLQSFFGELYFRYKMA